MIKGVPFSAGGRDFTLSFTMAHMKLYQAASGESLIGAFVAVGKEPDNIIRLSQMFRAACDPEISEYEADSFIDELGIGPVYLLLGEAAKASFGDLLNPPKAKPQPAKTTSTPGSTSG